MLTMYTESSCNGMLMIFYLHNYANILVWEATQVDKSLLSDKTYNYPRSGFAKSLYYL